MIKYINILFLTFLLIGCTGKETIKPIKSPTAQNDSSQNFIQSSHSTINGDTLYSETTNDTTSENGVDPIVAQSLESARKHYITALRAETDGDSTRCANEFEFAINILNDLSYYPGIEKNQDFNDLSLSIVEDYGLYIANIDSLGDQTSIFALREKLNQLLEGEDSPEQYRTREVMPGLTVPLVINGFVQIYMDYFTGRGKHHMERWVKRSGKYFPMMKRIFREENVPEELIYLSMIESGLNPVARSWAKAVGIWQFIKGTGKLYGLEGNWWYEDRRNVEKATRAAAQHLRDLYNDFGDWHLAIASYNSGPGRVRSAMRRSGTSVFWFLRKNLPLETRNYVPQYIAAAVIAMNPEKFGISVERDLELIYDVVKIDQCVDLRVLAECASTDVDILQELNPELLQLCTPPGYSEFELKIPKGSIEGFNEKFAQLPDEKKRDWAVHLIKKGETIGKIAKKYGISSYVIAEANNISVKKKLSSGQSLLIPVSLKMNLLASKDEAPAKKQKSVKRKVDARGKTKITYKVKSGDTLSELAERFDVRISDLRNWNDIAYGRQLKANATIEIFIDANKSEKLAAAENVQIDQSQIVADAGKKIKKSSKKNLNKSYWTNHVVRSGESFFTIAKKYGVTSQDIKNWNGIRSNKIMPGQELEIYLVSENPVVAEAKTKNPVQTAKGKRTIEHQVKKGDSLYQIAAQYKISVAQIKNWNNFRSDKITVGQVIVIYLDGGA
ncbi:MAG: LysM peptidoglycan-binding domain-containing protein [Bacteroidota bacterium]|nr:LysM peptidoglycan-binding domain-containing protein [Bacteroidota bacterium]